MTSSKDIIDGLAALRKGLSTMALAWTDLYTAGLPRSSESLNRDPSEAHMLATATIQAGERVLEVGCSTGYISEFLVKERGCRVVALEINHAAAVVTRERTGIEVIEPRGDDPNLPNEYDAAFDVILCADVIEHTQNPAAFLRQLLRYLHPEGRMILSVPNVAHWTCRWKLLCGRFEYEPVGIMAGEHLRFFTRDSLSRLLTDVGLEARSMRYSFGGWIYEGRAGRLLRQHTNRLAAMVNGWPTLFAVQFIIEVSLSPSGALARPR